MYEVNAGHMRGVILFSVGVLFLASPFVPKANAQTNCEQVTLTVQQQRTKLDAVYKKYLAVYDSLIASAGEVLGQLKQAELSSARLERSLGLLADQREDFMYAYDSFVAGTVEFTNAVCAGEQTTAITGAATTYRYVKTMQDTATFVDQQLYPDFKQAVADINLLITQRELSESTF